MVDEQLCTDEIDPGSIELPRVLPPGLETTVQLRVLGLTRSCWRCSNPTICLVGLYPFEPCPEYVGVFTTDYEPTMRLVVRLARIAGHTVLVDRVKPRYSKTLRATGLANGCRNCDAVQGNFPVPEEVMASVASGNVLDLETLFVVDCPTLEWQTAVHDPEASVIAI